MSVAISVFYSILRVGIDAARQRVPDWCELVLDLDAFGFKVQSEIDIAEEALCFSKILEVVVPPDGRQAALKATQYRQFPDRCQRISN